MIQTLEQPKKITKPGVYFGVPFSDYFAIPALNFHTLVHHERSAMQARHYQIEGEKDSDSKRLGGAAHAAILEPEIFDSQYVAMPKFEGHPNSNAYKAEKSAWLDQHRDSVVVPEMEMDEAREMRKAVEAHPILNQVMFESTGKNEVTIVWMQRGVLCKGRIDRICKWDGKNWIVDLKTTRAVWPGEFDREVARYLYHVQIGAYRNGLNILAPATRHCAFAPIQNSKPFECGWFTVSDRDLNAGAKRFDHWLMKHLECVKSGQWNGANAGGFEIELKKYVNEGFDTEG